MKYVVDTSLINKLVDGNIHSDELPKDGAFVASYIQLEELNRTKDARRKSELLEKFSELIDEVSSRDPLASETCLSKKCNVRDVVSYETIKRELDLLNGGKKNNSENALIAEFVAKNDCVLLTADFHLYQVAYALGIGTIYWTTT
jgi:hypothetical protein